MSKIIREFLLSLLVVSLLVTPALCVNTVTTANRTIRIIPDGTTDWDAATSYPRGLTLEYILFYPSAINDVICFKDASATGPEIFKAKSVDGGALVLYFDGAGSLSPYLDASDCTFGTAGNVRIILKYK